MVERERDLWQMLKRDAESTEPVREGARVQQRAEAVVRRVVHVLDVEPDLPWKCCDDHGGDEDESAPPSAAAVDTRRDRECYGQ